MHTDYFTEATLLSYTTMKTRTRRRRFTHYCGIVDGHFLLVLSVMSVYFCFEKTRRAWQECHSSVSSWDLKPFVPPVPLLKILGDSALRFGTETNFEAVGYRFIRGHSRRLPQICEKTEAGFRYKRRGTKKLGVTVYKARAYEA